MYSFNKCVRSINMFVPKKTFVFSKFIEKNVSLVEKLIVFKKCFKNIRLVKKNNSFDVLMLSFGTHCILMFSLYFKRWVELKSEEIILIAELLKI